ncbi:MAG: exodeoxyribonuclease VII small subunit [Deltaproteobacteria bacterium]|uniref:Exodeoxyribonuclease 7 small subunit n=1 Tax=Candidatus Zymogenus saltonus TaxID=2844893 RepID=A0A9D8PM35_9DELT|nr:exodeoxyribonuclease VII small subunit [Candidatus Zymogenus saltonus]
MARKEEEAGFDLELGEFDAGLEKLEEIVERLDAGELNLEESLSTFEEGMKLIKALTKKLEEAEKRIDILKKGGDGQIKIEQFEGEG